MPRNAQHDVCVCILKVSASDPKSHPAYPRPQRTGYSASISNVGFFGEGMPR